MVKYSFLFEILFLNSPVCSDPIFDPVQRQLIPMQRFTVARVTLQQTLEPRHDSLLQPLPLQRRIVMSQVQRVHNLLNINFTSF